MGCFSGRLMSTASDQKLFCKLCSPFCCSFDEFVEEKVISPSYSSAIFVIFLSKLILFTQFVLNITEGEAREQIWSSISYLFLIFASSI